MRNVVYSLAGLHLLLEKKYRVSFFQPFSINVSSSSSGGGGWSESFIDGTIFSIKCKSAI